MFTLVDSWTHSPQLPCHQTLHVSPGLDQQSAADGCPLLFLGGMALALPLPMLGGG
jgi:hypothetical protein